VEIYESEKEQVEALRRWWKENGRTVVIGLVLGLGGVLGYTSWQQRQVLQAETASLLYEQLLGSARAADHDRTREVGEKIVEGFPDSEYASLSALIMARSAFVNGERDAAKAKLRWVVEHGLQPELKATARQRLARILLEDKELDGALAMVSGDHPASFRALFQETKGDILVAQGKSEAARDALQDSLAQLKPTDPGYRRIQLKLDDLGAYHTPPGAPR
jgi:predicted negative regulator of RcsB-dependent stress response